MALYTDQTGRTISIPTTPQRIVSLVPSQTELLFALGLTTEVVGITSFCIHPSEWFRTKPRIGGTKSIHIDKVRGLQPDLIIANKEENLQQQVNALSAFCPVWTSNVSNLRESLEMIAAIGSITGTAFGAEALITDIQKRFRLLPVTNHALRTAYLIWQDPYMTIGADTFIHDMLTYAGFENVFSDQLRYPVNTLADVRERNCQLLLLASEPFPFKQQHLQALQQELPSIKIVLVDGEMFSWYGSRLLQVPYYFRSIMAEITPGSIPAP